MKLIPTWRIISAIFYILHLLMAIIIMPIGILIPFYRRRFFAEFDNFFKLSRDNKLIAQFSSEGEFEQIIVPLKHRIHEAQKVLLVYTSPSVKKKVHLFARSYDHVEFCMNPILNPFTLLLFYFYFRKVNEVWMVRYDFWPMFIALASKGSIESVLYAFTFKNRKKVNDILLKNTFDYIYTSTKKDLNTLADLGVKGSYSFKEFRVDQIYHRLNQAEGHPSEVLKFLSVEFQGQRCVWVWGQIWPEDFAHFGNNIFAQLLKDNNILLYFAPHVFKGNSYDKLKEMVEKFSVISKIPLIEIDEENVQQLESLNKKGPVIVFSKAKGILCEAYKYANVSYVGGGFGKSIHSVLEPFMSCPFVFCGPKIHRSTEFDICIETCDKRIKAIHKFEDFIDTFNEQTKLEDGYKLLENSIETLLNEN